MAEFNKSSKAKQIKVKKPLKRHLKQQKYLILVIINILLLGFLIFNK